MKNLQKLIKKVRSKYEYTEKPFMSDQIWIEKPLTDKAQNIVLKEIYRQITDPRISSRQFKYLINLYYKYSRNTGLKKRISPIFSAGDFDGDVLNTGTFADDKTYGMVKEWLESPTKQCIHRFENGNSALVDIGDGMCRCELCNIELYKDIVDESYDIENPSVINGRIIGLDLDELFKEDEEE